MLHLRAGTIVKRDQFATELERRYRARLLPRYQIRANAIEGVRRLLGVRAGSNGFGAVVTMASGNYFDLYGQIGSGGGTFDTPGTEHHMWVAPMFWNE